MNRTVLNLKDRGEEHAVDHHPILLHALICFQLSPSVWGV